MIRVRTEPRAQRARACDGAVGRLLGEGTVRPAVRRRVRALEMAQKAGCGKRAGLALAPRCPIAPAAADGALTASSSCACDKAQGTSLRPVELL